ncbi:MAG: hypothetical protein ACYDAG_05010 [Chloroflexota bacterium]
MLRSLLTESDHDEALRFAVLLRRQLRVFSDAHQRAHLADVAWERTGAAA